MKIVKMRVGKVLDLTTNELLYNVEFKFENQHRFMGYSIENWKDIWLSLIHISEPTRP